MRDKTGPEQASFLCVRISDILVQGVEVGEEWEWYLGRKVKRK